MSYKTLNDAARRRALAPFLSMADLLEGALAIIVIPQGFGRLLQSEEGIQDDLLSLWKRNVHEHLLRVTHLNGNTK